jgi:hypothetical protein
MKVAVSSIWRFYNRPLFGSFRHHELK